MSKTATCFDLGQVILKVTTILRTSSESKNLQAIVGSYGKIKLCITRKSHTQAK
jgi:hypothetical protein